jgi:hypothetical protein
MPVVFSARAGANGYKVEGPSTHCVGADQVFARWHWDGEQLVVENDRWGILPIFWAATPNAVHVSPSLDALLDAGVPSALDDAALAVFLRIGYFVGNDTPFLSIRALPPAARLTWSREGVQLGTHTSPFEAVADRRLHTETLHRRYPQYARIPFDGTRRGTDDRRAVRRDAADLLKRVSESRSGLIHRPSVAARILKALASGASRHLWFLPRVLHLLEVERRARGEASAAAATRAA